MALKPPIEGVRVLRGPDWRTDDDTDGGEGHLGTVQALASEGSVHVLWDVGEESTSRAGQDDKFDLRIFDTATVGVRHDSTSCKGCGEENIAGILWRCQQCVGCDLCSLCYANDKHELRHPFLRIDLPNTPGTLMKKRKISVRIRAMGLFPGAKVQRGKNWEWKDQDGGIGSEGEVLEIINKANRLGQRNLVKVLWPSGKNNVYRLAYEGQVDVKCTDEEAGGFYYRDHLPHLDSSQFSSLKMGDPASQEGKAEDLAASGSAEVEDPNDSLLEADKPVLAASGADMTVDQCHTLTSPADDKGLLSSLSQPSTDPDVNMTATNSGAVSSLKPSGDHHFNPLTSESRQMSEDSLSDRPNEVQANGDTGTGGNVDNSDKKDQAEKTDTQGLTTDSAGTKAVSGDHLVTVTQTPGSAGTTAVSGDHLVTVTQTPDSAGATAVSGDHLVTVTQTPASQELPTETAGVDSVACGGGDVSQETFPSDSSAVCVTTLTNKATGDASTSSADQDHEMGSEDKPIASGTATVSRAQPTTVSSQDDGGIDSHSPWKATSAGQSHTQHREDSTSVVESGTEESTPNAASATFTRTAGPDPILGNSGSCDSTGLPRPSSDVPKDMEDHHKPLEQAAGGGMSGEFTPPLHGASPQEGNKEGLLGSENCCEHVSSKTFISESSLQAEGEPQATSQELRPVVRSDHDTYVSSLPQTHTNTVEALADVTTETLQAEDPEHRQSLPVIMETVEAQAPVSSSENPNGSPVLTSTAECAPACARPELSYQDLGATAAPTEVITADSALTKSGVSLLPEEMGATAWSGEISHAAAAGKKGPDAISEDGVFRVGEKAVIGVPAETLKELQFGYGGVTHTMFRKIGREGTVAKVLPSGAVHLRLSKVVFRVNPAALVKTYPHSVGDTVRIRDDLYMLRVLNERLGWRSSMDQTAGKVGEVTNVDEDGDLRVQFGSRSYSYSPACCIPAPGCSVDFLEERRGANLGIGSSFMGGDTSLRDQLASLFSGAGGGGGGGGARRLKLRDLAGMSQLGDLSELSEHLGSLTGSLSQLAGGGVGGIALGDEGTREGQLQKAVLAGDLDKVQELCGAEPTLLDKPHHGLTPLMLASHQGKRKVLLTLLELGADVNAPGLKDQTALITALDQKEEEMALLLIEHGANINQRNGKERTPLHSAVFSYQNEAAQILLLMGADINAQDKYGDTPLHDSIARQNVAIVDLLVQQQGVNLHLVNQKGYTPLQLACRVENAQIVGMLLAVDSSNVNQLKEQDLGALHICVREKFQEGIRLLVMNGNADINLPSGRHGLTPLHLACLNASADIVQTLLDMGAAVNVQDYNGETPLHLAMGGNAGKSGLSQEREVDIQTRVQISSLLITYGAFVDAENSKGRPPSYYGHAEVKIGVAQFVEQNPGLVQRKSAVQNAAGARAPLQSVTLTSKTDDPAFCHLCHRQCNLTLRPCGHRSVCQACAEVVHFCPLCGTKVQRAEKDGSGNMVLPPDAQSQNRIFKAQAAGADSSTSDTIGTNISFIMNNKATVVHDDDQGASRPTQDGEDRPPDSLQPLHGRSLGHEDIGHPPTAASPTLALKGGLSSSQQSEAVTEQCGARAVGSAACADDRQQAVLLGTLLSGEGRDPLPVSSSTAVSSSPDNSSINQTSEAAKPVLSQLPPAASGETDVCKLASPDQGQMTGDEKSPPVDINSTESMASPGQQSQKTATAGTEGVDVSSDIHEEGSESEGNLLRVAVCRRFPGQTDSIEPVDSTVVRGASDSKPDEDVLTTGATCFTDNRSSAYQTPLDNRALTLRSENPDVPDSDPSTRVVDLEDDDLVLPDLPSMPAGGTSFGDWLVMGPQGTVNLTGAHHPPHLGGHGGMKKPNSPGVKPPDVRGEPQVNPWLMTDKDRKLNSTPDTRSTIKEFDSTSPSNIVKEKELLHRVQLDTSNPGGLEMVERSGGRSKFPQLSPAASAAGCVREQPVTQIVQTQAAQSVHSSEGRGTAGQIQTGDASLSHKEAGIEHLSSAVATSHRYNHHRQENMDGESSASDHIQHRNNMSQGVLPEAWTTAASQSQIKDRPQVQHGAGGKVGEGDWKTRAQLATSQRENSPHDSQRMSDNPRGRSDAEHTATTTTLITRQESTNKTNTKVDTPSFVNIKTYIGTDNMTAIFSSIAGPRTSPGDGNKGLSGRTIASPHSEASSAPAPKGDSCDTWAPDHAVGSGEESEAEGQNQDGQQSASESQPSDASSQAATDLDPQKCHSIQTPQRGEANPDHSQPHSAQGMEVGPQNTASQAGSEGTGETSDHRVEQAADDGELQEGDRAVIGVSEEKLVHLQQAFGGTTKGMLQCVGKTGIVTERTKRGATRVKFNSLAYRFNPLALMRVHTHDVGDAVRVRADLDLIRLLNRHVGYCSGMAETLGKVGIVTSIDQEGDLTVKFGQSSFQYSPACCVPAPGATPDNINVVEGASAESNSGESPDEGTAERQAFMQRLANMVKGGHSVSHITQSPGADSSDISRLFEAIKNGNIALVKEMCQNDPSLINGVHENRQLTTLMYASWKGQLPVVRVLLEMGADINGRLELSRGEPRHHSRYPLSAALEIKEEETAVFLLERGADPCSCTSPSRRTALHMAAAGNLVQVTQVLLQMGVDVNARDKYGDTPVIDALVTDSRAVADILLNVPEVDLRVVNVKGLTVLHGASHKSNIRAMEEILTRDTAHVNSRMEGGYAPMHLATENDCPEIIRLLALIGSADVNIKIGGSGEHAQDSPLHRACLKGYIGCVEALLDFGADVNVTNRDNDTPLHYAMGGRVPRDLERQSELYFQEERVRIACTLITNGAFVDIENNKGRTCMRYGGMEIVAAVQDFMDRNRHLVQKRGQAGLQARSDSNQPMLVLRGMSVPCSMCKTQMSDVIFLPCSHKAACTTCAEQITHCPLCQRRVDSTTTDDRKAALFEAIT